MATTTDQQNMMDVDSLNRLYRQAEDENAALKAELAAMKGENAELKARVDELTADLAQATVPAERPQTEPITAQAGVKAVRAWCRDKYGAEWHKTDKDARKTEAKEALK
jgi:cell division protein FtsB